MKINLSLAIAREKKGKEMKLPYIDNQKNVKIDLSSLDRSFLSEAATAIRQVRLQYEIDGENKAKVESALFLESMLQKAYYNL